MNLYEEILSYALTLPEAWEDHPWGEWVDESYRLVAPKRLAAVLDGREDGQRADA